MPENIRCRFLSILRRKGYDFNMSHGREDANDCHIDCLKLIRL